MNYLHLYLPYILYVQIRVLWLSHGYESRRAMLASLQPSRAVQCLGRHHLMNGPTAVALWACCTWRQPCLCMSHFSRACSPSPPPASLQLCWALSPAPWPTSRKPDACWACPHVSARLQQPPALLDSTLHLGLLLCCCWVVPCLQSPKCFRAVSTSANNHMLVCVLFFNPMPYFRIPAS